LEAECNIVEREARESMPDWIPSWWSLGFLFWGCDELTITQSMEMWGIN
jgi:hypothetical protein